MKHESRMSKAPATARHGQTPDPAAKTTPQASALTAKQADQASAVPATERPQVEAALPSVDGCLPGEEALIRVRNLKKYYRVGHSKVRALNGLTFDVRKGEFLAIVGTSGSGKSTLLNMLAGLEAPTAGEIIIAKRKIHLLNEEELVRFRRDNIGFIFQSFNLIPTLDAVENVALPLMFRGVGKAERTKQAIRLLKLVQLQKHLKHKPTEMSGGQQQRVGIARALVVRPQIIFADEPTGNLDSHTSGEIMHLMQTVTKKNQQTLIMVTHDDHLAAYADRIFRIIDGRIVSIEEGKNAYELQQTNEK